MTQNNISKKEVIMITVGTIMTMLTISIFVPILLAVSAIYIFKEMAEGNDGYSEGIDEWTKQLTEEEEDV